MKFREYDSQLSFMGGTSLRLVYGNTRLSEDIDLDNFRLRWEQFDDLVETVLKILNKFDVFTEVRGTPLAVLLSQKIDAAANQKRPKGQDFYYITFLLSLTRSDYGDLTQKMGIRTPEQLRAQLVEVTTSVAFEALAQDVALFLIVKRVLSFRSFLEQAELA